MHPFQYHAVPSTRSTHSPLDNLEVLSRTRTVFSRKMFDFNYVSLDGVSSIIKTII